MHDFCLTLPYGILIGLGGIVGYFKSASTMSLIVGGGSGLALTALGYGSLQEFKKKGSASKLWSAGSLVLSSMISIGMGKRYKETGALFPAGVLAGISTSMSIFYIVKLAQKKKDSKKE